MLSVLLMIWDTPVDNSSQLSCLTEDSWWPSAHGWPGILSWQNQHTCPSNVLCNIYCFFTRAFPKVFEKDQKATRARYCGIFKNKGTNNDRTIKNWLDSQMFLPKKNHQFCFPSTAPRWDQDNSLPSLLLVQVINITQGMLLLVTNFSAFQGH